MGADFRAQFAEPHGQSQLKASMRQLHVPSLFSPFLPLPRIGQIIPGLPIRAVAVLAMGLPVPFGGPMSVPFPAMLAPDYPMRDARDPGFVCRECRGIQVDDVAFGDWDFHSASPIATRGAADRKFLHPVPRFIDNVQKPQFFRHPLLLVWQQCRNTLPNASSKASSAPPSIRCCVLRSLFGAGLAGHWRGCATILTKVSDQQRE